MSILPVRGGIAANGKQSYTPAQAATQLTRESTGWSRDPDGGTTVTYAFRSSGLPGGVAGATFSPFNGQQIAATELALQSWADVANIRFVRVGAAATYSNQATILFGNYSAASDEGAAFAVYPGSRQAFSPAGDVWVRTGGADLAYNVNPVVGDYGQQVLAHEIGHTLGLSHPGDYDASDDTEASYQSSAIYYEDSRLYTIMSYFASSNVGASLGAFAAAPQMDDIAAIQKLYGANMATRAGDTTYGFNATADRPYYLATGASSQLVFTVWDGGGYDRLDFSGYGQGAAIDLRAGAFSDVGGSLRNIAIAPGVTIEEAVGGSGDDTMLANDAGDALIGGLGADMLTGGAGNDHLYGGGRVAVPGDGADTLSGGDGADYLQGNAGDDRLLGGDGSDRLFGGQGSDAIFGEAGNDSANGNLGDDRIYGGTGNDSLRGGQGNDQLFGEAGNDQLFGDLGDDLLDGGGGLDLLTGGPGADIFVLSADGYALVGPFADTMATALDFTLHVDRLRVALPAATFAADFAATAAMAEIVGYAGREILTGGAHVGQQLFAGWRGDTLVFGRTSADTLEVLRLAGVGDPHQLSAADFG